MSLDRTSRNAGAKLSGRGLPGGPGRSRLAPLGPRPHSRRALSSARMLPQS